MAINAIGDMAQSFLLRRQTVQARQEIDLLTQELATGRSANPFQNVTGDYAYLADIERNLSLLNGYRTAMAEAEAFTNGMQAALTSVQNITTAFAATLFETTASDLPSVHQLTPRMAADTLQQVVNALNSTVAGRSLFSGRDTNQPALADISVMMADLRSTIPAPVTADDLRHAVDQWFDSPGIGYAASGYLGASTGPEAYRLGKGSELALDLRADSPILRDVIKELATTVLASDPAFGLSDTEKSRLWRDSAARLTTGQVGLTGLRADLGYAQERIENGKARLTGERSSLEIARNNLLSVDPYESATRLQEAQNRLESIYAVTVRLSRLSLSEFMR
jgi:flagellar hook-associated protein 3 FlgL